MAIKPQRRIEDYASIMDKKRPESSVRSPMPMANRAAQFMPFAALTGFSDQIDEAARLVTERIVLSEERIEENNRVIRRLAECKNEQLMVCVVYFVTDPAKEGGTYRTRTECVRRIDLVEKSVHFIDGVKIDMADIYDITLIGEM